MIGLELRTAETGPAHWPANSGDLWDLLRDNSSWDGTAVSTLVLPQTLILPGLPQDWDAREQDRVGSHGGYVPQGLQDVRQVQIEGYVRGASALAVRDKLDEIAAFLHSSRRVKLFATGLGSDRYVNISSLKSFRPEFHDLSGNTLARLRASILCEDPWWYLSTLRTVQDSWTGGSGVTNVTVAGRNEVHPVITLTAQSTLTATTVTLVINGESITWTVDVVTVAGDVLVLDAENGLMRRRNSGVWLDAYDKVSGVFPTFRAGSNTVTFTHSSTGDVDLTATYRDRSHA